MKGYTINNSINLLENEVDALKGSKTGGTADNISYDNTSSHLTADNVQEALDEINTNVNNILSISSLFPTDTDEHQIGDNLYIKKVSGESLISGTNPLISELNGSMIVAFGYCTTSTGRYRYIVNVRVNSDNACEVSQDTSTGTISLSVGQSQTGPYCIYIIYTKNQSEAKKTRKK